MNLSNIRTTVIELQEKRLNLELKLIRSRKKVEPGSLIEIYNACNKGNCKCKRGEKHGPFLYLNQKINNKYKKRYVGKESDKPTVKRVRAYMQFQDTLAELRKINKEIDSLFNLYRDTQTVLSEKND